MVSSFGAESAVLLDMVASIDRRTPVVFLETGKLFPETLAYKDELVEWLRLEDVRSIRPDAGELARFDGAGDLWRREPDMCCHIRKTEPLDLALAGVRRLDHRVASASRAACGPSCRRSRATRSPASSSSTRWPAGRWTTFGTTGGCASCRSIRWSREAIPPSAASPAHGRSRRGKAVRAGRWWQLDKTECGIHRGEGI